MGEIITIPATSRASSGSVAATAASVPPVDVAITSTRRPTARPTASASAMSSIQSPTRASAIAAPSRPWPASRVKTRFAPSAAATRSGTGRISSALAE